MKKLLFILMLGLGFSLEAQIYTVPEQITIGEDQLDAFGRTRTASPFSLFSSQFDIDRQPLLWDTITQGTGTSVTHDATDKLVRITTSSTPTGGLVGIQTFQNFRYQPGKAQEVSMTFNMKTGSANVVKGVGYSDKTNGIEFLMNGTVPTFRVLSATSNGTQTVAQSSWNGDPMDGTGPSGITLDFTKAQILVIDFQALYVGKVRLGFNVGGKTYIAHNFEFANVTEVPYFQTANLPLVAYIENSTTSTDTLDFICSSVISSGGLEEDYAYVFTQEYTGTAGSSADAHIVTLRPRTTFNSITNRTNFELVEVALLNTGTNDVRLTIAIGQGITGGTPANVNTTYSTVEQVTGATLSGSPALIVGGTYAVAGAQNSSGTGTSALKKKIPLTLDHEGLQRVNGSITVSAYGVGGTSAIRVLCTWKEIR